MITVASYLRGIPPGNKNPEKPSLLNNFIEGVKKTGDQGIVVNDYIPRDVDVAVIQGYVHKDSKNTPHLKLRKDVCEKQYQEGKRTIIADSNLFLYADPNNTQSYLRYSYDGVFPNTGEYCNDDPDPARWDQIQRDLNINLKPWRIGRGNHILLCCQRNGGWSMGGKLIVPWVQETVKEIRQVTDRPIILRFHPGDKKNVDHMRALSQLRRTHNVQFSQSTNILSDLRKAHALISYNSSPGVVSAIEGVPTFVLDPEHSQAAGVSHHSLLELESPREFDREKWIQQIAQMHWRLDELKSGKAWQHMKHWARK